MKIINFIALGESEKPAYRTLVEAVTRGFDYKQTSGMLEEKGYYIPEDQFNAFTLVILTQIDLDIGMRQGERSTH